jgi:hypothetical protein
MIKKEYATQMIKEAELSKQSLVVGKEIIIDKKTTDDELGKIVRQMYKAKAEELNKLIDRCKNEMI